MNEQFRREQATQTLVAIVTAMEGEVMLGYHGFEKAYCDDKYQIYLVTDKGQRVTPQQADLRSLEEAIYQWRDEHMQFFQKILCAMM